MAWGLKVRSSTWCLGLDHIFRTAGGKMKKGRTLENVEELFHVRTDIAFDQLRGRGKGVEGKVLCEEFSAGLNT